MRCKGRFARGPQAGQAVTNPLPGLGVLRLLVPASAIPPLPVGRGRTGGRAVLAAPGEPVP